MMKYVNPVHKNTGAVTNVGVTPAAKPFDVMVGGNTYEGVAANYICSIRILTL